MSEEGGGRFVTQGRFDRYVDEHDRDIDAHGPLMRMHEVDSNAHPNAHVNIYARLSTLEKFMWMALGGLGVVGLLAGSSFFISLLNLPHR